MAPWVWSIILLLVAVLIVGIELFVPSGGFLGLLATLAVVGSVTLAFMSSVKMGLIMVVVVAIVVPAVVISMLSWWPHTPFGRRVLVQPPDSEEELLPDADLRRELKALVGKRGTAKTKMLPSGIVALDGRSYDAVGEGAPIEPGQTIRVVGVDMNRLVVRLVETSEPEAARPATENVLERPIESLGIESLDNPLV